MARAAPEQEAVLDLATGILLGRGPGTSLAAAHIPRLTPWQRGFAEPRSAWRSTVSAGSQSGRAQRARAAGPIRLWERKPPRRLDLAQRRARSVAVNAHRNYVPDPGLDGTNEPVGIKHGLTVPRWVPERDESSIGAVLRRPAQRFWPAG